MEGDGEVVARFRIIAFQSASCYPLTLLPGKRFGCWEGKGKACRSYILVARALSAGVRFVPGAAIAKSILYCAGQLVFKESGHHLTGTDTIYFVTVRL
ncbi:hypothetical protein DXT73_27480, partial [Escherichia coli]